MSKILKNNTGSDILINDTGITVVNGIPYTIPAQDYLLWAASSNIVTKIGNGNIIVNDGSYDLSISEGTDLIKGLYPKEVMIAGLNGETVSVTSSGDINALNIRGVMVPGGVDATKVFNIGIGAALTSPAYPAIKPLGAYIVPTGKTLKIHGVMFKTAAASTYFHVFLRKLMWKFCAVTLGTPATPTFVAKTIAGSQMTTLSTYKYKVVGVNIVGKTLPSTEATVTFTGTQNAVTLTWAALAGALYYEVYRTDTGGSTFKLLVSTEILTYTDVAPDTQLESSMTAPTSNTTLGNVDGDAFSGSFAASSFVIDTLTAITTPTALDILYKNPYGDLQHASTTPSNVAGGQVEIGIKGKTNPTNDIRIPATSQKKQLTDISISDIISIGNTPATGSFAAYGTVQLFQMSSISPQVWSTVLFDNVFTLQAGQEIAFGISSNAAITTIARSDFYLLASLE